MAATAEILADIKPFEESILMGLDPTPLVDWLIENGHDRVAELVRGQLFKVAGRGRNRGPKVVEPTPEDFVRATWSDRHTRTTHPEGEFDGGGRWYPSERESCGGSGTNARGPSRSWPYSYMLRCRSREHVRALVTAGVAGGDVPGDVIITPGQWRWWVIREAVADSVVPVPQKDEPAALAAQ